MGPFIAPILTHLGYTHQQAGLILATSALCTTVTPFCAGWFCDRYSTVTRTLRLCCALAVLLCGAMWWCTSRGSGLGVALVAALLILHGVRAPVGSLLDTLGMAAAQQRAAVYSRLRLSGSLGFMAAASTTGWLMGAERVGRFFPLLFGVTVAGCLATFAVPNPPLSPADAAAHAWERAHARGLWASLDHRFMLWLAAMMLHWVAFAPYQYGFGFYMQEQGVPQQWTGVLWSVGVGAEALGFFGCKWCFRRLRPHQVLVGALAANALRWALLGLFPSMPVMLLAQLLHGPGFALFYAAAMQVLGRRPANLRASYQGLFTTLVTGLSASLGTALGGFLHQRMGFHHVFLCMLPLQAGALLLLTRSLTSAPEAATPVPTTTAAQQG